MTKNDLSFIIVIRQDYYVFRYSRKLVGLFLLTTTSAILLDQRIFRQLLMLYQEIDVKRSSQMLSFVAELNYEM